MTRPRPPARGSSSRTSRTPSGCPAATRSWPSSRAAPPSRSCTAPTLLAARARLADGATITTTTHLARGAHVDAPPRLGLAGSVGAGGWRPSVTVPPALLVALLADPDTPIGERLDQAAQAEGLDPLDVLGPALMGLRELVRMGIVRTE